MSTKKPVKTKSGIHQFLVSTSAVQDSNGASSGGAQSENEREAPFTEYRMYVINRAGTGEASYLLLKENFSTILSYRVHTEKWRQTQGLQDFSVLVLGNYIYVLGGYHKVQRVCLDRVMRYEPRSDQWSECRNMLVARCKFGVCVLSKKIFVCGGQRSDGKQTGSCEMYDPETDTWTKCGMLLAPRSDTACAAYGQEVLCAGGCHNGKVHNNLWVYEQHTWQEIDRHYPHVLPYSLQKCAVAAVKNTLYFIGGSSSKDSHIEDGSGEKVAVTLLQTERRMFSYTTQISAGEARNKGSQLDLISPWNLKLPPMIHGRQNAGAVTIGQKIHVVGGTSVETGDPVIKSEHFDLIRGTWHEDFVLKNCDVSNVSCLLVEVPKIPFKDRRIMQRLKWVMW